MVPLKKTPAAVLAFQPSVAIHPVIQLRKFEYFFGASIDTQWYCPPDVGANDAISANEAAVARVPMKQKMKPYINVGAPPLSMAVRLAKKTASHVHITIGIRV